MLLDDSQWDVVFVEDLKGELVQKVCDFFNDQFPQVFWPSCTSEEFEWKLGESNPAGRGTMAVALCGSTVAGVITATRKEILIDGKPVLSSELGDTYTHPAFRKSGSCRELAPGTSSRNDYLNKSVFGRLGIELLGRLQGEGLDFVYGTPGREVVRDAWCRRNRCVEMPGLDIRTWQRPGLAILQQRLPLGFGRIAHIGFDILLKSHRLTAEPPVEAERFCFDKLTPESVLSSIDVLWESRDLQTGIVLVQDRSYFFHRYALHPSQSYEGHLIRRSGVVVALVITRRLVRASGNATVCVADWLLRKGEPSSTLEWVIRRLATTVQPDESLSLWTDSRSLSRKSLRRMGFVRTGNIFVIAAKINRGVAIGSKQHTWDMRIGWSDNV